MFTLIRVVCYFGAIRWFSKISDRQESCLSNILEYQVQHSVDVVYDNTISENELHPVSPLFSEKDGQHVYDYGHITGMIVIIILLRPGSFTARAMSYSTRLQPSIPFVSTFSSLLDV